MTNEEFYSSAKWKSKRKKILNRDRNRCQMCRRYGRNRNATTVHHIKHYEEYPELALTDSNLTSLCQDCHNKVHPEKALKATMSGIRKRKYY